MVNRGASRGCITCRERRVKCDETKPACKECIRLGRRCAGYERKAVRLRFRDETARYLKTANYEEPKKTRRRPHHVALPGGPQSKQQDVAVALFLTYVTDVGRDLESTRGFLEFVRPVLAAESHKSALFAAVTAAAVKLWALLRPSDVAASLQTNLHSQALVRLQQAVYSPTEQRSEATVFAALMLQHHDTMAAVFDRHKACGTHREGALALLTQKGHDLKTFKYRGYLMGNLFHSKISYCVRHKVPLAGSELDWLQREVIPALPSNPSSLLDVIGISISKLQSARTEYLSSRGDTALAALKELRAIICNLDAQLRAWLDAVPDFWHPRRIQSEDSIPLSVVTYDGSCDIYPSVQIANIWNTWRTYRLIVEHIKMELTQEPLIVFHGEEFTLPPHNTGAQHIREIQDLIEPMCRSIPFYLGNCSQPMSFTNIDNPQLVFPSYHDLSSTDEAFVNYKHSDHYATKIDHYRHVALHGPLHALSILSNLIGLLSEERCSISARVVLDRQKQ